MHRHTPPAHVPTVLQRLGVLAAVIVIFAAVPFAQWAADTLNDPPTVPATMHPETGWDCTVNGYSCGNGTGVDR